MSRRGSQRREIALLRAQGWSLRAIGARVGLSGERVRQLLGPSPGARRSVVTTTPDIVALRRALRTLLNQPERDRVAIRELVRTIRALEEELQAERIDRILGLP